VIALVREYFDRDERLRMVGIAGAMLGHDGKPNGDLLVEDGLHMSATLQVKP